MDATTIPPLPLAGTNVEHLIAWLGTLLAVLLVIGHLVDLALPRLRRGAALTKTKVDDDAVDYLARFVAVVMLFGAFFPRLRFGRMSDQNEDESTRPPRRRTNDGSGGAALALLAAALVTGSLYCSGCGAGVPRELRIATTETAHAVAHADRMHAPLVAARSAELRAELRQMARDALVASIEAGLAWYEERMAPHETATRVLEVAAGALRSVALALDAWDAGASDGPSHAMQVIACSVAAVAELVVVLPAVGLDVPEAIRTYARVAATYAATACPEAPLAPGGS